MSFQPEQLALFLWRIVPHIQEDFEPEKVHHLIQIMDSLKLNEAAEKETMVTFRGRRVPLRIAFYRYEPEMVGLYITTAWLLARTVEEEMRKFHAESINPPNPSLDAKSDQGQALG